MHNCRNFVELDLNDEYFIEQKQKLVQRVKSLGRSSRPEVINRPIDRFLARITIVKNVLQIFFEGKKKKEKKKTQTSKKSNFLNVGSLRVTNLA